MQTVNPPSHSMINHLRVRTSAGSWEVLPGWARFYVELGVAISKVEPSNEGMTVALIVPTRSFASVLVATGVVLARLSGKGTVDLDQHFQELSRLPEGTSVHLREGNSIKRGLFKGIRLENGRQYLGVIVQNKAAGGLTYWLPREECDRISIAGKEVKSLPNKQTGKLIASRSKILDAFLIATNSARNPVPSRRDCVLVGTKRELEDELADLTIGIESPSMKTPVEGRLRDLVLHNDGVAREDGWRTTVLAANGNLPGLDQVADASSTYILDGCSALRQWSEVTQGRNRVVLLERTEFSLDSAVEKINQAFYTGRTGQGGLVVSEELPPGVEMLVFREAA